MAKGNDLLSGVLNADAIRAASVSLTWSDYRERRRAEFLIATAQTLAGVTGAVLDVGCGNGVVSVRLAQLGLDVCALDLSTVRLERVALSAERLGTLVETVNAPAESLPFQENSFDLVICSEVLEHIGSPAVAAGEIRRVLRPNGHAVITVPMEEEVVWDTCVHCGELTPRSGHRWNFNVRDLSAVLTGAGLWVDRTERLGSSVTLKPPCWPLTRKLRYESWRGIDRLAVQLLKPEWLAAVCTRGPTIQLSPGVPPGAGDSRAMS